MTPKVRTFVDFVAERFRQELVGGIARGTGAVPAPTRGAGAKECGQ